ncbi:hypothetical protein ID858_03365 [Xenorhabdus sp. DI]|uniref:hypothetical protein n=1 Tax=Xenorhabdus doucetiae TaxID=351671 RepID=UPI00199CA130|nr:MULTISPECIES: hypothetical protein [unclassified Xenorhabdus]MBD2785083.1 hypothetical protein [Xenorhabdus sp. 3]MBD2787546.1 hypothetical protein [Xenorhabdus sp. DI]
MYFASITSAFANPITPDNDKTQVQNINNVPVVNIGEQGLVLNNAMEHVTSELAGQLDKNPNLRNRSATLIVNEVVGGNQSQLLGALEIVGDKAKVIIRKFLLLVRIKFIGNPL